MDKKKKTVFTNEKTSYSPRLLAASTCDLKSLYLFYHSSEKGLVDEDALSDSLDLYGRNVISKGKNKSVFRRFIGAFINPFTFVLLTLAFVSLLTDVILASPGEKNPSSAIIILALVLISGIFRFAQEYRSSAAAEKLSSLVENTTPVYRYEKEMTIPLDELSVGDVIALSVGDVIPADVRIISSKDFFVNQSSLSGESEPLEKTSDLLSAQPSSIYEAKNLAFYGSNVVSGSALALCVAVGDETILGKMAQKMFGTKQEKTAFDKGVDSVSWLLVKFMLLMVPAVFLINGLTKHDWLQAFLFAISVAVGLTPEMLPMIVSSCLGKGAINMGKKKVIVKNINSIQNFGAMDVLCTDKTGTLTQDRVVLENHLNLDGKSDPKVLKHAFLNSYYQTGLKNLMDKSIISKTMELSNENDYLRDLDKNYVKVDEIPFDFERKRMSVVVKDNHGKTQMISKGAVEEILSVCSFAAKDGNVIPLDDKVKKGILDNVQSFSKKGFRVIAVAQKNNPRAVNAFGVGDEKDMVLIGYLTFYDPPKESTKEALTRLKGYGISIKVLTGDNPDVSAYICSLVGLSSPRVMLGNEVDSLSDEELRSEVEKVTIFAKLSPFEKSKVVAALKENGHVVGYMGDGINDAPALKEADIGISVDTAADIAKESAHVILLEKDLNVLVDGIIEGRKTYANMIKYIKMTASSNFGNIFSELAAAALLPFLPMLPLHLLILNLIYDFSCVAIPFDNVDEDYLKKPRKWDASSLGRFMFWMGPTSSIFDWLTYAVMYFIICPLFSGGNYYDPNCNQTLFVLLFQTGWFVESMWSQSFVIHMIRTDKVPFVQSRASWQLLLATCLSVGVASLLPFIPYVSSSLSLTSLPWEYFIYLLLAIAAYMILATLAKNLYKRKYGEVL